MEDLDITVVEESVDNDAIEIALGLSERIPLIDMLRAREGNLLEMIIVKNVLDAIQIKESEIVGWNINMDGTKISWDSSKAEELPFRFTKPQVEQVNKALQDKDSAKKLNLGHITICEKFGFEPK